ncbi:hypothetical protein C8A05DRAFT_32219 [Staphylotrichum tortipilum]|uniref:Uncharacterized protein n=1 Tax=Staphylotrichum tortipilum TaxID=2831512 RepID=A0AAN6RV08_9PEZI|nr:hypothetical protein C8A05DRAFT_32219 [Staphylotrichum longicolle]
MVHSSNLMVLLAVLSTASLSTALNTNATSTAVHPTIATTDHDIGTFDSPTAATTRRFALRDWTHMLRERKGKGSSTSKSGGGYQNGAERVSALGKGIPARGQLS